MIDVRGKLYGTTFGGGREHAGTEFALDPKTGTEKIIWSFCGTNCEFPSGLVDLDDKLYGTMPSSGTSMSSGCGMVFVIAKEH
jgi:uncharacterized repeat protein (TIGR03803 family)